MTISIKSPTSTTGSIQKNGSDVLTIDSSDNVTVVNNLSVSGTVSSTGAITFDGGTISGDVNFDSGTLYVDATNNRVGIGTTSPSSPLTVSGISSLGVDQTDYVQISGGGGTARIDGVGSNTNVNLALSTKGTGAYYLWGNGYGTNTLQTIDSLGNVNFGYVAEAQIKYNGMTVGAYVDVKHTSAATSGYGYMRFFWNGSIIGQIVQNGTTGVTYNTSSDYRLKENVALMSGSIDRLKKLKPSTWTWRQDGSHGEGFIAHETQAVVPEAVTGTKDAMRTEEYEVTPEVLDDNGNVVTRAIRGTREVPDYQGIDQSKLVPLLTAALQEAITKIEDLETRIQALENPS